MVNYRVVNLLVLPSRCPSPPLRSETPGPAGPAALSSHVADPPAESCGWLWDAWGVCFHGYRHCSRASQHSSEGPAHPGPQSTGEHDHYHDILRIEVLFFFWYSHQEYDSGLIWRSKWHREEVWGVFCFCGSESPLLCCCSWSWSCVRVKRLLTLSSFSHTWTECKHSQKHGEWRWVWSVTASIEWQKAHCEKWSSLSNEQRRCNLFYFFIKLTSCYCRLVPHIGRCHSQNLWIWLRTCWKIRRKGNISFRSVPLSHLEFVLCVSPSDPEPYAKAQPERCTWTHR